MRYPSEAVDENVFWFFSLACAAWLLSHLPSLEK